MKVSHLVVAAVTLCGGTAFAKCPPLSTPHLTCKAGLEKGDHPILSKMFTQINFCIDGSNNIYAELVAGKQKSGFEKIPYQPRTGGVMYMVGGGGLFVSSNPMVHANVVQKGFPDKLYAPVGSNNRASFRCTEPK